ncbi:MAG TPA: UDP-N-acetylglucosamine 2-epimerase (non-hydrolyzing) [Rhodocyclaceae bacterium]|nr:UDP-N-acetylglucosamine 2-epimerase (non-hydrolyzing) [Rhodocyclaceae bacterium]
MARKMLYLVAGARPNFMKIAPIVRALQARADLFDFRIIHTGQHYDRDMSDVFFEELGIPQPDYHLECGGGSHAEQTAKILIAFEKICLDAKPQPDCVLVVGDVNSTLACSIVAKKLHIAVAHVEAGLRSGDMSMPEEINRLVTDSISDWFFCTEPAGVDNLLREGKDSSKVFHVGHVMVDNLLYQAEKLTAADKSSFESEKLKQKLGGRYGVVTLHRPSNVDDPATLKELAGALTAIAQKMPLVFPVHPRTRGNLEKFGLDLGGNIHLTKPLSYMEFLNLWKDASLILTDSGGLQEETTALGIPCLTLRENTERPITLDEGTNTLVGTSSSAIIAEASKVTLGQGKQGRRPKLWDGKAAVRIVNILFDCMSNA